LPCSPGPHPGHEPENPVIDRDPADKRKYGKDERRGSEKRFDLRAHEVGGGSGGDQSVVDRDQHPDGRGEHAHDERSHRKRPPGFGVDSRRRLEQVHASCEDDDEPSGHANRIPDGFDGVSG